MKDEGSTRTSTKGKLGLARFAAALVALLLLGVMASGALADGDPFSALDSLTGSTTTSTSSDATGADGTTSTASTSTGETMSTDSATTTEGTTTTTTTTATSGLASTPSIASDKADYQPGSTVTLTGSGWGAGEAVHLLVNDTLGKTWQYNGDVVAGLSGAFTTSFELPNTFISNYDVTATAATGETATTTFTDGNAASVSGTVTDSVTHAAISGATVTCDMTTGCSGISTTTTDSSGDYVFDSGTTKLSFGTNGPVTLTLKVSKAGYADGTITIDNVNNKDVLSGENVALIPSGATKLTFTTVAATGTVGQCLGPITVQTQNAGGAATNVTSATTVDLTSDNDGTGAGLFYGDSVCSSSVTSRSIASGSNSTSFFYEAAARGTGSHTLTAAATGLTSASQTETINKAPQTITFSAPSGKSYGGSDFDPGATASSGLAVGYSSSTPSVCTIASAEIHIVAAGNCSVTASQLGDSNYSSATEVTKTFTVAQATATVSITWANSTYNGSSNTATASVDGVNGETNLSPAATLEYFTGAAAGALGSGVTTAPKNAGTYTVRASFVGNTNYGAAAATKTIAIAQATASVAITWANSTYDGSSNAASATVNGVNGETDLSPAATLEYFNGPTAGTAGSGSTTAPTNAGTYAVRASFVGNGNYNSQAATTSITIDKALSSTTVTCAAGPFVYDGTAQTPCSATVTGTGGLSLTPTPTYMSNTDAGTATASYTYAGDTNYNNSSDTQHFTIGQAHASVTVTWEDSTYDGLSHPASASVTGVGSPAENLGPATTLTYFNGSGTSGTALSGAPVHAGAYTVLAEFNGNTNYLYVAATKTITLKTASSSTVVTCPVRPYTYDGTAQTPCSVSVTGVGGLHLTPGASYSNNTDAGTATASYSYPGDADHDGSSDSQHFTIDKASSSTVVSCPAAHLVYDGSARTPCTASVTGAGGLGLTPAPVYSDNTDAGTATVSYTYAGDPNHEGSADTQHFTIDKASSTTVMSCPAAHLVYDGSARTPCTASVTGAGGLSQALSVAYTDNTNAGTANASASYGGDANHEGSSDSSTFVIDRAGVSVVIGWSGSTYNGLPNAALASVTGPVLGENPIGSPAVTFEYFDGSTAGSAGSGLATAPTNAGTYAVRASFAGNGNYNAGSSTKSITIAKAASTTVVSCPTAHLVYDGLARTPCTASVTGAGGLSLTRDPDYSDNTDAGTATATYTYAGDANHEGSADTRHFTIDKAPSSTTVSCTAGPFTYDGLAQTPCSVSVTGAGGLSLTPDPDYSDNTDAGTATVSYTYPGDPNHEGSAETQHFTIDKATVLVAIDWSNSTYDHTANAAHATVTGPVLGENPIGSPAVTFEYFDGSTAGSAGSGLATAPTNAGTYAVRASFAGNGNYKSSSETTSITIAQHSSTVTITWANLTYDGTTNAATATVAGVPADGDLMPHATLEYFTGPTAGAAGSGTTSAPTNAGTYSVRALFVGSGNYLPSSATASITIAQHSSTVNITWANSTYDGSPNASTATVAGVPADGDLMPHATFEYFTGPTAGTAGSGTTTTPTNAGTYSVRASFVGNGNYLPSSSTASITIAKASSTTTITCPASVTYTGSAQTPCTAQVTGPGGLSQALTPSYANNTVGTATVTASYAGDSNHNGSNGSTTFLIAYGYGEVQFLQPINGTAHNLSTNPDVSTFKAGSTVPVKVQVVLANGTIVHPASATWLTPQQGSATTQPVDVALYSDPATSGSSYTWGGQFFQYNWGTPKTGAGHYWLIGVKLDDGQNYTVYISLR